jgi:hypothetical protein
MANKNNKAKKTGFESSSWVKPLPVNYCDFDRATLMVKILILCDEIEELHRNIRLVSLCNTPCYRFEA